VSYRDFTLADVETKLGLTVAEAPLFADVAAVPVRPEFQETLSDGTILAQGIDSEKARSEFLIAPVLLELRRTLRHRPAVFSGVEFNVDPAKGLNGYCDFLITRSTRQHILTAPVIAVAEGKNDKVSTGLGQCVAGMRAAWLFNVAKGEAVTQVYGVSTTGTQWKILRLRDTSLTIDTDDYFIADPGRILAILVHMVETA
jgi:hypothetical protein